MSIEKKNCFDILFYREVSKRDDAYDGRYAGWIIKEKPGRIVDK